MTCIDYTSCDKISLRANSLIFFTFPSCLCMFFQPWTMLQLYYEWLFFTLFLIFPIFPYILDSLQLYTFLNCQNNKSHYIEVCAEKKGHRACGDDNINYAAQRYKWMQRNHKNEPIGFIDWKHWVVFIFVLFCNLLTHKIACQEKVLERTSKSGQLN